MEWYSAYHMVIPFFTVFGNKGKYEGYSAHDYQYLIYCSHYLVDIGSDWYFRGNLFDAICKKQGKLVRAIRFTTEVLSGIPSIIFGLFGYTVFCILFRLQTSIIAGCLTMAICVLPTIIRTTEEALLAVRVPIKKVLWHWGRKIPCYYGNCFALRYAGRIDSGYFGNGSYCW